MRCVLSQRVTGALKPMGRKEPSRQLPAVTTNIGIECRQSRKRTGCSSFSQLFINIICDNWPFQHILRGSEFHAVTPNPDKCPEAPPGGMSTKSCDCLLISQAQESCDILALKWESSKAPEWREAHPNVHRRETCEQGHDSSGSILLLL